MTMAMTAPPSRRSCATTSRRSSTRRILPRSQALTEILIPTDETPGAREAHTAHFIDFVLQDVGTVGADHRTAMAAGDERAAGRRVSRGGRGRAAARLVDAMSKPERDRTATHPAYAAYRSIKQENTFAFYTSRAGHDRDARLSRQPLQPHVSRVRPPRASPGLTRSMRRLSCEKPEASEARRETMATAYDAVMVGSGACGGWAAMELTRAGHESADARGRSARRSGDGFSSHVPVRDGLSRATASPGLLRRYAGSERNYRIMIDNEENPYTTSPDTVYRVGTVALSRRAHAALGARDRSHGRLRVQGRFARRIRHGLGRVVRRHEAVLRSRREASSA